MFFILENVAFIHLSIYQLHDPFLQAIEQMMKTRLPTFACYKQILRKTVKN